MKILYYTWNENSQKDMAQSLLRLGHEVWCCQIPFSNYEEDVQFLEQLKYEFSEHHCDCFLSFDFFPLIAKCAECLKKPYISWVYDTPHYTIFSPAAKSSYVKLFVFDRVQFELMKQRKTDGLFYQPLAANVVRLEEQLKKIPHTYEHEVSFVGSLYEKNLYRQIVYLPDYLRGFLEGMIQAQQKIYGYNFIEELFTAELTEELNKYIKMQLDESYQVSSAFLYANMINAEITARERAQLLSSAAKISDVVLYSGSECLEKNIVQAGIVDYETQMPQVFYQSKINLNMTLRSITSGIPLRALDIMGAGGFLLSNYQPELAEYFVDGQDLVLFESEEDMCFKIQYYLEHENERREIAQNGFEKVKQQFSYEVQLEKILKLALGE